MLVDAFRPREWSQASLTIYCSALADLDEQYVQQRTLEILQTSKFMPSIAEIRSSPDSMLTADDVLSRAKYLLHHPSERKDMDMLTRATVQVVKKLGGWAAFGRSPDPEYAPPSQTNAYKAQVKDVLETITLTPTVEHKALQGGTQV